jgi:hypothetical protein
MVPHEFGNPFASDHPARDEDPGVQLVKVGTRRTHDVATVLTRHPQETLHYFARRVVDHLSAKPDRVRAVARLIDLAQKVSTLLGVHDVRRNSNDR